MRAILFFPVAAIRLLLVLIVTVIIGFAGRFWCMCFGLSQMQRRRILQLWGKLMIIICGIRVSNKNLTVPGQYMIMSNHRSYLDIFILATVCPAAFVAKAEVRGWPMMKTASLLTNMIFVNRGNLRNMAAAMERIKELVQSGNPVIVFPEGTTYKGPLTGTFKKGSFRIAVDLGISVLPVALHYEDEEDSWIGDDTFAGHFFRQMGKPVTRVRLSAGKCIRDLDAHILRDRVQFEINSLLLQMTDSVR